MPLLPNLVAIVAGIVLLFAGGELFVAGATALALLLGIPQIVVGLTVVSLGTSAPELFVSLLSLLKGGDATAIAASNVVGSNIFNVLVVLGLSALVVPLRVRSRLVRRDVPLLVAVSMVVWGMASGTSLTWQAGLALLVGLVINVVWEIRTAREHPEESEIDGDDASRTSPLGAGVRLLLGLALLVLGSQVLLHGATSAAVQLGVSQTLIGLTIVAAGTSLPELVTSLVAAYRGSADLAIGNVVGSCLINLLLILGLCALASGPQGLPVDPVLVQRDLPVMVLTTLACLPIFWTNGTITRLEGGLLVGLYGLYLVEQLLTSTVPWATAGYRQVLLVVVLPLVLVYLVWQVLAARRVRLRG
ncbi:MAG: calcium/sodium antiporter [Cyanobacteria bacterium J06638_7]